MKNKKRINVLIFIICFALGGRIIYFEVKKKQFISNLETAIYSNSINIVLKELTPFEWDELYWGYSDSYGFAGASIGNIWKFYNKDKVVAEINLSSKSPRILLDEKCLCPSTAKYLEVCYTPSTAIFEIIRSNKYGIVQLKSNICTD